MMEIAPDYLAITRQAVETTSGNGGRPKALPLHRRADCQITLTHNVEPELAQTLLTWRGWRGRVSLGVLSISGNHAPRSRPQHREADAVIGADGQAERKAMLERHSRSRQNTDRH